MDSIYDWTMSVTGFFYCWTIYVLYLFMWLSFVYETLFVVSNIVWLWN